MPVNADLLKRLKPLLKTLEADLLERTKDPGVAAGLDAAWRREKAASRTAAPLATWTRRRCTQVGIAWILSAVFVRTLEDRGFLARRRIGGSGAEDSEALFTQIAPFLTARDYLLSVFRELSRLPGAAAVFDAHHNPVWVLAPSADGARALLDFFRQSDKKGEPPPDFDGEDTRFLGDLYQHLSEDVRKRYALLQTPEFVEEFILEQTLDPAIEEFGLSEVRLIDPTCGSGHFLLGAFRRLLARWLEEEPGGDRAELAARALAQVHGVDLNPYAVAIARFRLTLEFLGAAGIDTLERAPRLPLNLCVADSLLHGVVREQMRLSGAAEGEARASWGDGLFALEDETEALRILKQRYHAVVGNPPYITEKDARKRAKYRELYKSAAGKFALAAPFTERFFGLAVAGGFVGLINANSFMKRDFGKKLIKEVLPRLDINGVFDTSGAYIPGHGTPTLLMFGRNQPAGTHDVVAVLGKRGESEEPAEPATAPVWSEIIAHHTEVGFEGRHLSVEAIPRGELAEHPWVLVGGGARDLKARIESASDFSLSVAADSVGISSVTGEDDVYLMPPLAVARLRPGPTRPLVEGSRIRDWAINGWLACVWIYSDDYRVLPEDEVAAAVRYLGPFRANLSKRKRFGVPMLNRGLSWYELQELYDKKLREPPTIAFPFVSTHNHFVLDRDCRVFKQTAPIIKLKDQHDEADHLTLLGILNSSTIGLWCRLVMFLKGGDQVGDGARLSKTPWEDRLEYAGNLLKQAPIVDLARARGPLLELVREAERTVEAMQEIEPARSIAAAVELGPCTRQDLEAKQQHVTSELLRLQGLLVSIQEEIDWRVYGLYGLPTVTAPTVTEVLVSVAPEHRPFEVRLARDMDDDLSARIWFARHKRTPPVDVDGPLADLYRQRLRITEQYNDLQLLETPETKRRWPPRNYAAEFKSAYRDWLLERIEAALEALPQPAPLSARQLASELQRDTQFVAVAEVFKDEASPDLEGLVGSLMKDEGVPYLASLRYATTGMEKRRVWETTWRLQREEDAGEAVAKIPVPPPYTTKDYRASCWTHRGKLDVPKERFVLYPDAGSENDDTPLAGWAGWDHPKKAQALAALYQDRKNNDGWERDRLLPLLAGLDELVPWLKQWHNEPDPAFQGTRPGESIEAFVAGETSYWGFAPKDLKALNANAGGAKEIE